MPGTLSRHKSQAGLSLVELIIGMAVTSLVLSGVVAIVFTLTHSYNAWVGRIGNASNGDVLAAAIAYARPEAGDERSTRERFRSADDE